MKENVIKKLIICGIVVVVIGLIVGGALIIRNKKPDQIIDKPLEDVKRDEFLDSSVKINISGIENYKKIYKSYVKPNYPNIKVDNSLPANVTLNDGNQVLDFIKNNDVLDLSVFMKNSQFGLSKNAENNINNFILEYLYQFNEDNSTAIYAIPEYINIPSIIYNHTFVENFDVIVPDSWSELGILKSELSGLADYEDHVVAGYDRNTFNVVKALMQQGYDEDAAIYIAESWEKNNILKGYDFTNYEEITSDLPVIFICPNVDTIKSLKNFYVDYAIGGMLLDEEGILHVNLQDGKNGKYFSITKGDNVYEDIASWLYIKESLDTNEYYEYFTLKLYMEEYVTNDLRGVLEKDFIIPNLQLLALYEQMLVNDKVVFYK
ncbi:MAG: hypothetical protein IJX78_01040 [Bacilli bacterium]|nr:hypothetical protein [Bacilli bacterium]